uniref:Interleukin-12 subunit beta n=1 Tax=Cynoglossus semilaevis TaxID=244447 RepID=A0A3P8X2M7_CYNSE
LNVDSRFHCGCCSTSYMCGTFVLVLVLEVNSSSGTHPLSCLQEAPGGDHQSQEIIWRKDGEEEEQRGNVYLVQLKKSLGGGNYSCHSREGSLLNYTLVLIQEKGIMGRILVRNDQEDYIKCSAQNYNGHFHCSWSWHPNRVSRVAFIKAWRVSNDGQCSVDKGVQRWTCPSGSTTFVCTVEQSGDRISCVDQGHCPYSEETQRISVSVYVVTQHFLLENYSKRFHLFDIVKPDKVSVSQVNSTMIQWSYPPSWSSPSSYFPLRFQVAQLRRGCSGCDDPCADFRPAKTRRVQTTETCHLKVWNKAKTVCVRATDALCNSQWSEWSHVRLRRHKKNKKVKHHPSRQAE